MSQTARIRVALVDNQRVLLDSMRSWLDLHAPDIQVIATETDWATLTHGPQPQIVVAALNAPRPRPLEDMVEHCHAHGAKVVLLGDAETATLEQGAKDAGADAYCPKTWPLSQVVELLRTTHRTGYGSSD